MRAVGHVAERNVLSKTEMVKKKSHHSENLPGEVVGALVVVCRISGFTVWGMGIFGNDVVLLTGGLVVCCTSLATVPVTTAGTAVVRTRGFNVVFGVVLCGAGGRRVGGVVGARGCTGAAGVGTAGTVQKQRRWRKNYGNHHSSIILTSFKISWPICD